MVIQSIQKKLNSTNDDVERLYQQFLAAVEQATRELAANDERRAIQKMLGAR
jgi:hypothetical protein